MVFASTSQKTISAFDLRTEQIVQHYEAHHDAVNQFSIHPDGTHMVSVSANSEIKVWDIVKGTLAYTMYGHNGEIKACAFSNKGDFFATGGSDCNLLIWKSAFSEDKGESIKDKGLCQSGHRNDLRTIAGL